MVLYLDGLWQVAQASLGDLLLIQYMQVAPSKNKCVLYVYPYVRVRGVCRVVCVCVLRRGVRVCVRVCVCIVWVVLHVCVCVYVCGCKRKGNFLSRMGGVVGEADVSDAWLSGMTCVLYVVVWTGRS